MVEKNGQVTKIPKDKDHEAYAQQILRKIMNKNSCDDIFKNTIIDSDKGLRMYPKKTHEQFLETKI